jgi:phage replication-related protein YjqB (UPF0714/DUF867 family)
MDKYKNFEDVKKAEDPDSFEIKLINRNSRFLIFAPHAGGIEQGTSEICRQIAGNTYSYYLFAGNGNKCMRLHITSTNFDEPALLGLLRKHQFAVSIHGMTHEMKEQAGADIYLGGLNRNLILTTTQILRDNHFETTNNIKKPESKLSGKDLRNVTNKCISGKGMQVEISENLRATFFTTDFKKRANRETGRTEDFYRFCEAVVQSIIHYENENR